MDGIKSKVPMDFCYLACKELQDCTRKSKSFTAYTHLHRQGPPICTHFQVSKPVMMGSESGE